MNEHRQAALERVKTMVLDALGDADAAVILFGSCATGDADRASDIDIALLPRHPLPGGLISEIAEMLEESTVPYEVDIVDLSRASPDFRARVEAEGIWWRR
jgi:uncharacterized protein